MMSWRYRLVIVVLALTAFWPVLHLGFLWDDHVMIETNPSMTHWSLSVLREDFTTDAFRGQGDAYYRPAQILTNRVDYTLWGLRPFGYHLTNLLTHALNALLAAELVAAFGFSALVALSTGCLLAVHPIVVEQLMIVAGRAELFGLCFTLLTLLVLFRKGVPSATTASFLFFMGLLYKESVLVLPLLAVLCFALRRERAERYLRILWLLPVIPVYLWLRHHAVGPVALAIDPHLASIFFFKAFPQVLLRYLTLLGFPWNLHSHRMMPSLTHWWPALFVLLIGLAAGLIWKRRKTGLFCLAWFIVCLLPKTPIMMTGNFTLDHWVYPGAIGVFLPLSIFFAAQWDRRDQRIHRWMGLLFFPLLIAWALMSRLNIELRGTDEKMYRWALHFTTSHPIQQNLGITLLQQGRALEAIPFLENVRAVYPEDARNTFILARAYSEAGYPQAAYSLLKILAHRQPPYEPALRILSTIKQP
ncbi:MAG: tetratricopeptide repeat protein [Elusimicrobiota bacterium]|jgi:hypothetical protein